MSWFGLRFLRGLAVHRPGFTDHDPRHDSLAEGNKDAGADARNRQPVGNEVCERAESRHGNGDVNGRHRGLVYASR